MASAKYCNMAACFMWCWCAFLPFSVFAGVMYQKDYVVREDMGNRIWCEPHVVQKNESLIQLFREKGEIVDENIEEFFQIFKRLNPHVTDVETIQPGQQILIPLKKMKPDRDQEHVSRIITLPMVTISGNKKQTVSEAKMPSEAQRTGFTEYRIKPGDTLSEIFTRHFGIKKTEMFTEKLRQFRKMNPELDNINRIHPGQIIRMPIYGADSGTSYQNHTGPLERVSSLLQTRLVRKGLCFFPMPGKDDFRLDLARFPLMELPDGLRILFNPDHGLTQNDLSVIHSFWQDLKVIDVSYDASVEEILEQVLNAAPYLADRIDNNRQDSSSELLQKTSRSSVASTGRRAPLYGRQPLIEALMRLLGVSYTQHVEISFPYAGVQISSRANWIQSGKGKPILVDFGSFYGDALQALEKAGFIVIQILDTDSVYVGASLLLNALAVSYSVDPEIEISGQPTLKIPGIRIDRENLASLFLTEAVLNHEMIQTVQEKGWIILTSERPGVK